jgi:L-ascorbate metabolism protein UlaG (beta-lactamase superfamily)
VAPDPHHQRALELGRHNAERATPRYRSILLHWLGRRLRRARRVKSEPLPKVERGQVSITWGGHATVLIRYHRVTVLTDPVLSRSVIGVRRETAPGFGAEAAASANLVLVTSGAGDHLDLATLARVQRSATVVVPQRTAGQVSPLGFARLVELGVGETIEHRGLLVEANPVRHGDRHHPAVSYVLRGEGPSIFFCGASGYFEGFARIGARHKPDLAFLPIAGYWPPSFRERNMSPIDALYAFEDLRARLMVPIGYGTFALSYEKMHDPERWMAELVKSRSLEPYVAKLRPGESRVFVAPPPGDDADDDLGVGPGAEKGSPGRPGAHA